MTGIFLKINPDDSFFHQILTSEDLMSLSFITLARLILHPEPLPRFAVSGPGLLIIRLVPMQHRGSSHAQQKNRYLHV